MNIQRTPQWFRLVLLFSGLAFIYVFIAWKRLSRRAEWLFLEPVFYNYPKLVSVFSKILTDMLPRPFVVDEVTFIVYSHRGYGWRESVEGKPGIYWEAPLGITLWKDGKPFAGMAVEMRWGYFCIRQLQGVAGAAIPPELAHWPRLFVEASIRFARRVGLKGVRLYRADQSLFYFFPSGVPEEKMEAYQQRLRRRYDGTARQLGFTMKKRYGEFRTQKSKKRVT